MEQPIQHGPNGPSKEAAVEMDAAHRMMDVLGCSQNNISSTTVPQVVSDVETAHGLHPNDDDRFSIASSDGEHPEKAELKVLGHRPRYDDPETGALSESDSDGRDQCNLYVSGLPPAVNEQRLGELFGVFGRIVSCKLMLNIHTGESRGFAFVLFQRAESAHKAVAEMDHLLVDGSRLTVRFAEKRARLSGLPTKKIFIRNIPLGVTESDIRALFEPTLPIVQLSMRPDPYRPTSRPSGAALAPNVAHVIFETFESATAAAKKLHNTMPWKLCTVPVLAKVVDTGVRAKREQTRNSEPRPAIDTHRGAAQPEPAQIVRPTQMVPPMVSTFPPTPYQTLPSPYMVPMPQLGNGFPFQQYVATHQVPMQPSFVQQVPMYAPTSMWTAPTQMPMLMHSAPPVGYFQAPPPTALAYPPGAQFIIRPSYGAQFPPPFGDSRR